MSPHPLPPPAGGQPRVWLAAPPGSPPEPAPADLPTVRDSWMRVWEPGTDGRYHSVDGWHHLTWPELRSRFDLVELLTPFDQAA
jgi:hypothetical protein